MHNIRHDIFISYSRQDSEVVMRVYEKLISEGFTVWIDKDGVESGDAFKSKIVKAIEDCNTVLFFSSKSSNESYWTTKEVSVAIYEGKKIIPIRLDGSKYNSEIKFDLINLDYIDMSSPALEAEGIERLIKSLKSRIRNDESQPNKAIAESAPKSQPGRKSSFKFLFQYKGCLVSLAICLIGVIVVPFLFKTSDSSLNPGVSSSPSEEYIADLSTTFSKEGFIMDVASDYGDYMFAVADSAACDMAEPDNSDYVEPEKPDYIIFMENGIASVEKGDYKDAYNQFLKAANLEYSDAMYNVAISQLTGLGAEVDTVSAVQWLQKAAKLYNEPASIKLEHLKTNHE